MTELARKQCVPCRGGVPGLAADEIGRLHGQIPRWVVAGGRRLSRQFAFRDFATALGFVDRVGALAEEQGHHPNLQLSYGRVLVEVWTHKIDALTESDFVLAAKIDELAADARGIV